jgi:hypothetical protein
MCVFKSLTGYTDYGGYENQNAHFNNDEIKGNEQLMLLHDQKRWMGCALPLFNGLL